MASKIVLVTVLSLFCVTLVLCSEPVKNGEAATGAYDTKYDNIDLEELLRNDRLRKNYVKCLLGQGPCTPDGLELKNSLPDAIATDCSKCTEKQRSGSQTVTYYLIDNHPNEWDELAAVFDKDGEYKRKYLESKQNEQEKDTENIANETENEPTDENTDEEKDNDKNDD